MVWEWISGGLGLAGIMEVMREMKIQGLMDEWGVSQAEGRLMFISVMLISISIIGMKLD